METLAFESKALLQLLLAVGLGAAIGLEREIHGRPAGLRTHILVCVGATIIMLAAKGLEGMAPEGGVGVRVTVDPGRIAAGIITGIGFLGAGCIIKSQDYIRGITTAACLWFVAALGIVIGEGFYLLATGSTIIALIVLTVFQMIDHVIPHDVYRTLKVVISEERGEGAESIIRQLLAERRVRIQKVSYRQKYAVKNVELIFQLRTVSTVQPKEILHEIYKIAGIVEVGWG